MVGGKRYQYCKDSSRSLGLLFGARTPDWNFVHLLLQIGYYHLCGVDPSVLSNTAFRDFEYVFVGAWARITRAIETAGSHGLGVLLGKTY